MTVTETFFSLGVNDMDRALAFYAQALGAAVSFLSPAWSSLLIANVRVGLAFDADHTPTRTGLHFAVTDLEAARTAVARAGGSASSSPVEVAPGVVVADVIDTEGNTFVLTQR